MNAALGRRFISSSRSSIFRLGKAMEATATAGVDPGLFGGWTREQLIARIIQLEGHTNLARNEAAITEPSQPRPTLPVEKPAFDFTTHPRRKIALKFCYSGWEYSGLACQQTPTPLPTVENVLFDALAKAHLIDPEAGFEGCEWERCGRTDRGVSAAGQVVSLYVRSRLSQEVAGEAKKESQEEETEETPADGAKTPTATTPTSIPDLGSLSLDAETIPTSKALGKLKLKLKPFSTEFDYLAMLNRLLPITIRIIAWSPVQPTFSARFSCKYRHYKYFFSSLNLSIPLMRQAAERLLGEHDFRNLCKLDAQKQITSFKRKILKATIKPVEKAEEEGRGRMYCFDLAGTAFLYHQVRHIMAMLFIVGSGLEPPERITELLNVSEGAEPLSSVDAAAGKTYAVVGSKPDYQMADALPLMLWDCAYGENEVRWRTTGQNAPTGTGDEFGIDNPRADLYNQIQASFNRSRVFTSLDVHFLKAVEKYHPRPASTLPLENGVEDLKGASGQIEPRPMNIPLGGGTFKRTLKYKPILERKRLDPVEVANERWRLGKGARREGRKKATAIVEDSDQ